MSPRSLFFDESGFTGHNLLDREQPIFTIASTDISADLAKDILQTSFPNYRGAEFKFTNIWRSNSNRSGLIRFAERLRGIERHTFTWMIDKKFGALTKVIDFLIEPIITNAGYDFYADGFSAKYANYIYFGLTNIGHPGLYEAILSAYQEFSRNPSRKTLARLATRLGLMANSVDEPLRVFLEQMHSGAVHFEKFHNLDTFVGSDELQLTSMLAVIAHWRQIYFEDFIVLHDASSNFFRQRELWTRITNARVPEQLHPTSGGTHMQFPLRVSSTIAVDSKDHYQVQFCDVLAGLAAKYFNRNVMGADRELLDALIDAGLGALSFNGIRPDTQFPDHFPPRTLTGPDAVDRMSNIIFGRHNDMY